MRKTAVTCEVMEPKKTEPGTLSQRLSAKSRMNNKNGTAPYPRAVVVVLLFNRKHAITTNGRSNKVINAPLDAVGIFLC